MTDLTLQLEEKMKQIDALTENKVYADPVKAVQEQMLADLLAMRADLAVSIENACQAAAGGGSGAGSLVAKADYDALAAENKKLKYRITHLLRALDQVDGGVAPESGPAMKLYTTSALFSNLVNQVQLTAALAGSTLEVVVIDEETRTSKPHQKLNPTGRYPLLETQDGTLAGVGAICKFIAR